MSQEPTIVSTPSAQSHGDAPPELERPIIKKAVKIIAADTKVVEREAFTLAAEFKAFILRGNVVDLAVGVVIGAAFNAIVNGLVTDLITPLVAALGGKQNFSQYYLTWNHSQFKTGDFLNTVVSFLIIASVVFFFVVKPINALTRLRRSEKIAPEPTTRDCPYCLNAIPSKAIKCGFCTADIVAEDQTDPPERLAVAPHA